MKNPISGKLIFCAELKPVGGRGKQFIHAHLFEIIPFIKKKTVSMNAAEGKRATPHLSRFQ